MVCGTSGSLGHLGKCGAQEDVACETAAGRADPGLVPQVDGHGTHEFSSGRLGQPGNGRITGYLQVGRQGRAGIIFCHGVEGGGRLEFGSSTTAGATTATAETSEPSISEPSISIPWRSNHRNGRAVAAGAAGGGHGVGCGQQVKVATGDQGQAKAGLGACFCGSLGGGLGEPGGGGWVGAE